MSPAECGPRRPEKPTLTVVVPVFNEEASLPLLHAELSSSLAAAGEEFEILYVDDGSSDATPQILSRLVREDPRARCVRLRRNFGQTAALAAGFDLARGEGIVTLDADLQNDPADIPRLLGRLRAGADVVSGWRRTRRDAWLTRRLPSRLANRLLRTITGLPIHDSGCTLKAYRASVLRRLPLYAEMHRFLPVLATLAGARVEEIEVGHRPRRFGRSKYGIARVFRVALDMMTVKMLVQFAARPLHWFGIVGLPFLVLSGVFLLLGFLGSSDDVGFGTVVYPAIAVLLFLAAIDLALLGLLAELTVRAGAGPGRSRFEGIEVVVR